MSTPWQPANDTERVLAEALAAGDRGAFFRTVTTAELYLPQVSDDGDGSRPPDRTEQTFVTVTVFGHTALPVFTSLAGLAQALGDSADAYTVTGYAELREKWPAPEWLLAVNPGLPLDAYLRVEAVEAAARGETVPPTVGEALVDALAEDPERSAPLDPHELLREAAARADVDGYVDALLDATVTVPTTREVTDPTEITEPGFPWYRAGSADRPVLEVYTSADAFAAARPDQASVSLPFVALLAVWPEGYRLAVNPGDPTSLELTDDQVHTLLLWARADEPTPRPDRAVPGGQPVARPEGSS